MTGLLFVSHTAFADVTPLPRAALMGLAQQFVSRVSKKFDEADKSLGIPVGQRQQAVMMDEGESLLFNIKLPDNLLLDNVVVGEIHHRRVVLSLRDYVTTLDFPIEVDGVSGTAKGWFIREAKTFALDLKSRTVVSDGQTYPLSADVIMRDDDIIAPSDEIATWFGLTTKVDLAQQRLEITPSIPLPIQEKLARAEKRFQDGRMKPPELPLMKEEPVLIGFPFVDVSSVSNLNKNGKTGDVTHSASSNVTTTGDFLYGTLTTQTQTNDVDLVSGIRANYKKESLEPELLGPLKARRYELGDIIPPRLALSTKTTLGSGMRITNVDPTRNYINATTGINGFATPGWDVELYRNDQLLAYKSVGDDGVYQFDNVDLFSSNNSFRVVLYGPQGEIREEQVNIPVDPKRLAESGSIYDISVTADGKQLYRKEIDGEIKDEDEGSPRIVALYETPIGDESALQLGIESGTVDGESAGTVQAGLSTTFNGAIVNLDTAVDQAGEMQAELALRKDYGEQQVRNTLTVSTDRYGLTAKETDRPIFKESFALNGPFPVQIGTGRTSYGAGVDYAATSAGVNTTSANASLGGSIGRVAYNHQINAGISNVDNELSILGTSSLRGSLGRTRIRLGSSYDLAPEKLVQSVGLNLNRTLTDTLDGQIELTHNVQSQLEEVRLQADWETGHGIVSPSLTYNSNGDAALMVNTHFGAARNPQTGKIETFDDGITASGGLSAFVFLDENGDGVRQDNEQPIEGAQIRAIQAGGREKTDETGHATFHLLQKFRQTDIVLDADSLADPYWIPASKGVSLLPREGHMTEMNFPVVKAGEMDGTVYARTPEGVTHGMGEVGLGLYNFAGKKIMSAVSESDGFFIFSLIPPGDYFLIVDQKRVLKNTLMRPDPVPVKIGYDGTIIYANNIYLDVGQDTPMTVVADVNSITSDDPALDPKKIQDETVLLNLGSYHSRVMMGVMWYKARAFQHSAVAGLDTLVAPSDSYAATKTGLHTLRIGAPALTLENGKQRCGLLNAAGIKCTVEILPGGLQMAKTDMVIGAAQ